jgi:SpoVK/Ycf46/Vps4 family AAA+-type ATPase
MGKENAAAPKPKTKPKPASSDGVANDRYKSDMEQAAAMRRGMEKRRQLEPSSNSNEISEADVLLGLKGLDEADSLRERGDLQKALKVSEMSLELLIEFLKSDPSLVPTIGRDTVGARLHVALSDAEEMKRRLKQQAQPSKPQESPPKPSSPSAFQSLSAALGGAVKRVTSPKPKSPPSLSKQQSAGQSTSSSSSSSSVVSEKPSNRKASKLAVRKISATPNNTSTSIPVSNQPTRVNTSTPAVRPISQSTTSPSNQPQKPSPFYNSNDPLVQTIKSDLYVDPSQLQDTSWDDIAGLETAKQSLQEAAILPLIRPDLFTGLRKPQNILLYGPPGTGKTMLVKAVAKESQCLLFICTASALTSKWHGEGEKLVRTLFEVARAAAPSIIFVDEMDALLSSRKSNGEHEASRRFKTEFMTQMDGIVKGSDSNGKHLLVISCTNCPWDIDSAVLRRFPRRIYVPLPDKVTRKQLVKMLLEKAGKHSLSSSDRRLVVKRTDGFSGSDIASIASEASFFPLRALGDMESIRGANAKDIRPLSLKDFEDAIDQATKSVSTGLLQKYQEWKQQQAAL